MSGKKVCCTFPIRRASPVLPCRLMHEPIRFASFAWLALAWVRAGVCWGAVQ